MKKKKATLSEELVRLSKTDLKASKLLYKHKYYSQSVFYFQQSVEKFNKSIGLEFKLICSEDLCKKIGHFPIKLYKQGLEDKRDSFDKIEKLSKRYKSLKNIDSLVDFNIEETNQKTKNFLEELNKRQHNPKHIIEMSEVEINEYLNEIYIIFEEFEKNKIEKNDIKINEKDLNEFKTKIIDLFSSFSDEKPKVLVEFKKSFDSITVEMMNELIKKSMNIIVDIYPILLSSVILSILTIHGDKTRYPDNESNNPLDIYNEDLPFIRLLPELFIVQEKIINKSKLILIKN